MRQNSPRDDWFFQIEEAPILVTVTLKCVRRGVRVPHKKAPVAADTGDIFSSNTKTGISSRSPQSPRFRRNHHSLERRARALLRDCNSAMARPGFSFASHVDSLSNTAAPGKVVHR